MVVGLKYVYSETGEVEAAIVPIQAWRGIEEKMAASTDTNNEDKDFDPTSFKGMLSHYDFDVMEEVEKMRSEWTRNF